MYKNNLNSVFQKKNAVVFSQVISAIVFKGKRIVISYYPFFDAVLC